MAPQRTLVIFSRVTFTAALILLTSAGRVAVSVTRDAPAQLIRARALALTHHEVDLAWTALTHAASGYRIARDGAALVTVPADSTQYVDDTAQPGTRYSYSVLALDATGAVVAEAESVEVVTPVLPDTPDETPPTDPEDFTANARPGYILLDWYASHDNTDVTAYVIRRNGQRLTLVHGGVLEYYDGDVSPGTEYRYSLEAIDASGNRSRVIDSDSVRAADSRKLFLPAIETAPVTTGNAALNAAAYDPKLRRYPYLTDLVNGHVAINWATDGSSTIGSVTYGRVGVESCTANSVAATKNTVYVNAVATFQWKAQLSLLPNTQYCYRVFLGASGATDLLGSDPSPTFWTQVPAGK